MIATIAAVWSIIVFWLWTTFVGNAELIETVLGVLLSLAAGVWVYFRLDKLAADKEGSD